MVVLLPDPVGTEPVHISKGKDPVESGAHWSVAPSRPKDDMLAVVNPLRTGLVEFAGVIVTVPDVLKPVTEMVTVLVCVPE